MLADTRGLRPVLNRTDAVSSLPRLSRTHPLPAPAEITTSTSFTELEAWEIVARQHIELAKRAYDAWVFHREHFFAAGGDLVDRLEGRGEGPDGTDLARGAWEEVRLRGEKAEAVLKRAFFCRAALPLAHRA